MRQARSSPPTTRRGAREARLAARGRSRSLYQPEARASRRCQRVHRAAGRDAGRTGGWLSEWYGERTLHDFLDGEVIPDSYAVLRLPDRPPLHVFVELDRGTETLGRLQEKATRYRKALRWRDVRKLDPLVLLVVPSAGRSQTVSTALAGSDAPLAIVVWSKHSTGPVLTAVLDAEAAREWERRREREDAEIRREVQAQGAVGTLVGGLRSGMASDLLDHPQQPE
jgi:hypothetical protein